MKSVGNLVLILVCSFWATGAVIVPGGDWRDTDGKLIAATEGGFLQVGDTFYLWGMDRSADNYEFVAVNCYSSTDMKNWKFAGQILKKSTHPDLDGGVVVERAKILYNDKTKQFVMWMHYEGHEAYTLAQVAYATSPGITQEFTFHEHFRPLDNDSRDLNVYKDDDGKAYLISSTNTNSRVRLFLLDDTYTKVEKETFCGYADQGMKCEGHGILHSEGRYYWLMSLCTGWDFNDNHYFYSSSLSGAWTSGGNIAVTNTHTYESQVGFAFTLRGSRQTAFVFMGDRWSTRNFGKTRLVVLPIVTNGTSLNVPWYDEWNLDAETGEWSPCARKFAAGTFTITAKHSGLVLGVKSGSNDIVQQKPDGSENQLWSIENRGASHFRIVNVASGKSFDVADESKTAGAKLLQWDWKDSFNQKWHIIDCGDGYHRFINVNTLGKTLEIKDASTASEASVVTGDFSYRDHQMFRIASANKDFSSGGMYQLVNRSSGKSLCLDNAAVSQNTPSDNALQTWRITDRYDSYFTIENVQAEKALCTAASGDELSAVVSDGQYQQQWQFVPATEGYYKLVNRMNGKVIASSGGKVVQAADANGSDKEWKFEKVDKVGNRMPTAAMYPRSNASAEGTVLVYTVNGQVVGKTAAGSRAAFSESLPNGIFITRVKGGTTSFVNLNLK